MADPFVGFKFRRAAVPRPGTWKVWKDGLDMGRAFPSDDGRWKAYIEVPKERLYGFRSAEIRTLPDTFTTRARAAKAIEKAYRAAVKTR